MPLLHTPVIFIVGSPRSGTTMMGRIIGNHPRVHVFKKELQFFEKIWRTGNKEEQLSREQALHMTARLLNKNKLGTPNSVDYRESLGEAESILAADGRRRAIDVYANFLEHLTRKNGKSMPCEHTPGYIYYANDILESFARAYIINMVRDPRDVLLSQKKRWRLFFRTEFKFHFRHAVRIFLNYHPVTTTMLWNAAVGTAFRIKPHPRVMAVKFEEVLSRPEENLASVCRFLGLDFERKMLEIPVLNSSLAKADRGVLGVDPGRTGNWKKGLSRTELWICQKVAARNMMKLGYERVSVSPNPISLIFQLMFFPLKAMATFLLFHLPEIGNPVPAIKRRFQIK